jgi:hypothetical protein
MLKTLTTPNYTTIYYFCKSALCWWRFYFSCLPHILQIRASRRNKFIKFLFKNRCEVIYSLKTLEIKKQSKRNNQKREITSKKLSITPRRIQHTDTNQRHRRDIPTGERHRVGIYGIGGQPNDWKYKKIKELSGKNSAACLSIFAACFSIKGAGAWQ